MAARQELDTLINTVPLGVVILDMATGKPLSYNREARRIADILSLPGQSLEALMGMLTFRLENGRETSLLELPVAQTFDTDELARTEEIVLQGPDGGRLPILVNATPVPAGEDSGATMVVTVQDLTPMENLTRQRAEFVDLVSRELRAPAASIKGSASAALRTAGARDPAEMNQFFHIINDQADHMLDLISNLMDAARIDSGDLPVFPESSEVGALVEQARNDFLIPGSHICVRIDLPPDLPRVLADRRHIVRTLVILLSHAERFSQEHAVLRIGAAAENLDVVISIVAAGPGVPPERLRSLFWKFGGSEDDDGQPGQRAGTGLDLAICRGVVEAHGGRIWAENSPDQGIQFTFSLPTETVIHSSYRMTGQRRRVLVVEANPANLRQIRRDLTDAGYRVTAFGDPDQALRVMAELRPHLVLTSLVLPGIDAGEFVQAMLEVVNVPILCLTDMGREQDIDMAFEMGADDYLVRPYSPTELATRIQAVLSRRAAALPNEPSEPYVRGALTIDFARRLVTMNGQPLLLTATEYGLLAELAIHAGSALTYDHLLQRVWGWNNPGNPYVVRTHLMRLRRKLGEDGYNPTYILAEPRVGYRMVPPDEGPS